jgi:hypothetical protein
MVVLRRRRGEQTENRGCADVGLFAQFLDQGQWHWRSQMGWRKMRRRGIPLLGPFGPLARPCASADVVSGLR